MTKLANLVKTVNEAKAAYDKAIKEALEEYRIQTNLWHKQFQKTPALIRSIDEFLGINAEDLELLIDANLETIQTEKPRPRVHLVLKLDSKSKILEIAEVYEDEEDAQYAAEYLAMNKKDGETYTDVRVIRKVVG